MSSLERSSEGAHLALAFIVKNEGRLAIKMMESVLSIVDFVAFVDTGSTDDSVQSLCDFLQRQNVEFVYKSFASERFDEMRNAAIDLVPPRSEWILMLDADEVLTPVDAAGIVQLTQARDVNVWRLPRYNWRDKVGGVVTGYPDYQARLFRNRDDLKIRYSRPVHEVIANYPGTRNVPIEEYKARNGEAPHIHHLKFLLKDKESLRERQRQYERLTAREQAETPLASPGDPDPAS